MFPRIILDYSAKVRIIFQIRAGMNKILEGKSLRIQDCHHSVIKQKTSYISVTRFRLGSGSRD